MSVFTAFLVVDGDADGGFCLQMQAFRECWKRHGNDQRTETRDA